MRSEPKRKRSPWFAFYPDDFDSGTRAMSLAGRGAFVALLSYQFANGSIPSDDRTLCRIAGAFPDEWESVRSEVLAKFEELEDGTFINRRMEKEREEREGIREKRIAAVQKRWGNGSKHDTSVSAKGDTKQGANRDTSSSSSPSPSPSPSNGSLQERDPLGAPANRIEGVGDPDPSLAEIRGYAARNMIDQKIADAFFDAMEAIGWLDGRQRPIKSPEHALKGYARTWKENESRGRDGKPAKPIPPGANPADYDESGKLLPFALRNRV